MIRRSRPIALLALAVLVAGAAGAALVVRLGGDEIENLERGLRKRDEASANLERIVAHLEEIAEELSSASGLPGQSEQIRELTAAQRRSIQGLIGTLQAQVEALAETTGEVEKTGESAEEIARLSAEEAARLRRTVAELRDLRRLAEDAGATSAELARLATYGALLAEDAREAFSEP